VAAELDEFLARYAERRDERGRRAVKGAVPNRGFDPAVPLALRYDPVTNPTGARGTIWDSNVSSIGRDAATGFARSLYDNVGVQYGLKALASGAITTALTEVCPHETLP
jgi:hypothetical protein